MIDYKALAKRLEMHAECHANIEPHDDEQRQWADDLRTVVSLLEEMAEAKPVAWMHDGPPLHGEASITPEPDAWHEFSLYAHPAPQPRPERQPVSEPTDRCKHGVRFPHECRECEAEPSIEKIQRWRESEGLTEREPQPEPIDPHMIVAEDRFPDEPEPTEAQIEARDALLDFISENGTASEGVQHYLDRYVRAALAAKEDE